MDAANDLRVSWFGSRGSAALLLALTGVMAACGADSPTAPSPETEPLPSTADRAEPPLVQVVRLADLESILADHKGHGFLLNFWAIWCLPCVQELPELDEISRRWSPKGGKVLTVNYDLMVSGTPESASSSVRAFLDKHQYSFGALILDEPDYDAINERLSLPGPVPVTLAIDAAGEIVDRQDGQADAARFEEMMRRAVVGE